MVSYPKKRPFNPKENSKYPNKNWNYIQEHVHDHDHLENIGYLNSRNIRNSTHLDVQKQIHHQSFNPTINPSINSAIPTINSRIKQIINPSSQNIQRETNDPSLRYGPEDSFRQDLESISTDGYDSDGDANIRTHSSHLNNSSRYLDRNSSFPISISVQQLQHDHYRKRKLKPQATSRVVSNQLERIQQNKMHKQGANYTQNNIQQLERPQIESNQVRIQDTNQFTVQEREQLKTQERTDFSQEREQDVIPEYDNLTQSDENNISDDFEDFIRSIPSHPTHSTEIRIKRFLAKELKSKFYNLYSNGDYEAAENLLDFFQECACAMENIAKQLHDNIDIYSTIHQLFALDTMERDSPGYDIQFEFVTELRNLVIGWSKKKSNEL